MKIGIITAISLEAEELMRQIDRPMSVESWIFPVYKGAVGKNMVTIVQAGVGKVCTAMATQWLIDTIAPDVMIDIGIAGSLSSTAPVGSIVIGNKFVQHDFMPAPWLDRKQGEIPFMKEHSYPTSSPSLNTQLLSVISKHYDGTVNTGTILSGDEPIFDEKRKNELLAIFRDKQPLAIDMESAAFAFVANENNVPFTVMRAISDRAIHVDKPSEVGANAKANGSAQLVAEIISRYLKSL